MTLRGRRITPARDRKPGSTIRIRTARVHDAARMAVLSGQLGYPVTTQKMKLCIRTVSRRKIQKLFVAEVRGQIAGWVEVFRPVSVLNWGKAEVGALVVDAASRGKGIGHALLDGAREWAETKGSQFIYLRSNVKRTAAHEFYRKAGYKVRKTQSVFQLVLKKSR